MFFIGLLELARTSRSMPDNIIIHALKSTGCSLFITRDIPIVLTPRSSRHSVVAIDTHRCNIDYIMPFVLSCATRSVSFLFFVHGLFLP